MERLRRHALYLTGLLIIAGVVMWLTPPRPLVVHMEKHYQERVPHSFGHYVFQRAYDMGEETRNVLHPDGMVCHIYSSAEVPFIDFVLLAGSSSDAFHDPQLCFRNQGWRLDTPKKWRLHVGAIDKDITVNLLTMKSDDGRDATAAYFFISPLGYTASAFTVKLSLFAAKTFGVAMGQGYFLRFLVLSTGDPDTDLERLGRFINDMMGELKKSLPEVVGT
jgi:hypothetical protein